MAGKKTRQKMINMMYLVLTAMLALNVSTDVLNGFELMEDSLVRTIESTQSKNQIVLNDITKYAEMNPRKAQAIGDTARWFKTESDSLIQYIQELKERIATYSGGTLEDLKNKEATNAASAIMLSPQIGEGAHLRKRINAYRETALRYIPDQTKREAVEENLTTKASNRFSMGELAWEESLFYNMPTVSAITLLSKIQSDVASAQAEVLHNMANSIDVKDFRVNQIQAYVIPNANTVIRGARYSARVVLAAEDSTKKPQVFIGGKEINGDTYTASGSSLGEHTLNGYIAMTNGEGETSRFPFSQKYTVVEPTATVSASLMNVFYAGFENPVSISVPGIDNRKVTASMTNGTLARNPKGEWVARPSKPGTDAVISIMAEVDGRMQQVSTNTFRVRALPTPSPYLMIDNTERYAGGTVINRNTLLGAQGVGAGIYDGLLNIPFNVLGFDIRISNGGMTQYESSNGNKFSPRQTELIKRMSRGSSFNISNIKVKGPDGIVRQLTSPIEVLL
ncbi:MAG: gliding motility protein GldM [Bacteroidales bacterium]